MNSVLPLTPPMRRAPAAASPVAVLIIDADPAERRNLAGIIATRGEGRFVANVFASAQEAERAIAALPDGIVLANLETIGSPEALSEVSAHCATIATSANPSLAIAVAAMRGGAADFLPKPIGARALIEHLTQVLSPNRPRPPARRDDPAPSPAVRADTDFAGFIGRSPPMQVVYDAIRRMAPSHAPVFLTGESGTGKELAAEAVHAGFSQAAGRDVPFVALNCSAIPRDLMESEIFGHVRGAFTGASEARPGAAELADGGILFLDEIAEMDVALQAKLLRFLQDGRFRRVGGSETIGTDVRVVSATNRDPQGEIAAGRLRADLFHRLHVLPLSLPPLRQRGDDILRLAGTFLGRFSAEEGRHFTGFAPDAVAALVQYAWPGNVRELAAAIRRVVVLHDGPLVSAAALAIASGRGETQSVAAPREPSGQVASYAEQERAIIEHALSEARGNIARAAALLGISPATIYRKRHSWRTALSE
jgi:two-component system repressor protein LuxO